MSPAGASGTKRPRLPTPPECTMPLRRHLALATVLAAAAALPLPSLAVALGDTAPAFELKDTQGKTVKLADFKGRHVVLEWTNNGCPYVQKHYNSGHMQGLQREAPSPVAQNATDFVANDSIPERNSAVKLSDMEAANDSRYRWRLVAGMVSLALVSLIGWQGLGPWADQPGAARLAQGMVPVTVPGTVPQQDMALAEPQVMIRDPQLDALLAAHKQFGGTSALQMPAGFLRNATFEGSAR